MGASELSFLSNEIEVSLFYLPWEVITSAFTFMLVIQIRNKGNHAFSLQKLSKGNIFDLNAVIK